MPYDGKILSRAMARFDEDKQRRARQFRERQQQLFAREPELADIDRRLRGTMSQIITRALQRGQDPVPAIHAIRDENLALQRRRGGASRGPGLSCRLSGGEAPVRPVR